MRTLLLLLLLLFGCSIEKRGAPGTNPDTELEMGEETRGDSVVVRISAPSTASVGDVVPITLLVQNNRDRTVDLHLMGRDIVFDIAVARADSTIVWQRLKNATVQMILQLKSLAPGEAFTLSDHWRAQEAGQYVIGAELPTDDKPLLAEPVSITIR